MVFVIRLGMLVSVACLLAAVCLLFGFSHESFTELIFSHYGEPAKLSRFREILLTPERFAWLRWASIGLAVLCAAVAVIAWRHIPVLWQRTKISFLHILLSVGRVWRQTSGTEKLAVGLLFLTVFASRIWFLFRLPLHVDERFTYLYFVAKGWAVSAAYYPNPNNHILFSLACNIANIFTDNPLLVLRLPALVFGMAALAGFWFSARYYFSGAVSFFAAALLAFTPIVFSYGIQGRGYGLLLCWTVAASFSLVKTVSLKNTKPAAAIFTGSSILGFYTVPVFLYPFAGMCVYAFLYFSWNREYSRLVRFVWLVLLVAAGVFMLYLPVFLFNGWQAVSGNGWVAPLAWPDFTAHIADNLAASSRTLWHDLPVSAAITLIISTVMLFALFSKRFFPVEKHWLALYLCCLWVVVPAVFLQRILLHGRVLVYVFPLQWLAFTLLARGFFRVRILPKFRKYHRAIALILVVAYAVFCLSAMQNLSSVRGRGIYNSLDGVSAWLYGHHADHVFVQYYEYGLCILFAYETNQRAIGLDIGTDRFSAQKRYNFVVVHQSHRFPAGLAAADYRVAYHDGQAKIYQLKK